MAASETTTQRTIKAVDADVLGRVRRARSAARSRAWDAGARPDSLTLDIDATLITAYSEKDQAAGNYKHGFGFYPLGCWLAETGEPLAAVLRPGNAGSNTAADHFQVLQLALAQIPAGDLGSEMLVRADTAGASHAFAADCRQAGIAFSFGYPVDERVRDAVLEVTEAQWQQAIDAGGENRDGAWVTEITSQVNLDNWPEGSRLIVRRERPHPGAQFQIFDSHGYRHTCFLTDQAGDIAVQPVAHAARPTGSEVVPDAWLMMRRPENRVLIPRGRGRGPRSSRGPEYWRAVMWRTVRLRQGVRRAAGPPTLAAQTRGGDARRSPLADSVPIVRKHVLILGAGFGGLELGTQLSERLADRLRVTLIDRNDSFFFGFSKLEVMLGRQSPDDIRLHYGDFQKEGVEFRQETVTGVDPAARSVSTNANSYDADFVVVALGADYDFAATPGFEQGGHEYYSLAGAERLRDALADFDSGRVLVSVLGQPFKCPPAPFEGCFLLDEHFTRRGIRDTVEITATFPMARPVPVTGEVSQMFRDALAARNIKELPLQLVTSIDPASLTAHLASGETLPYDLFVGIPVHRAPTVLEGSGLLVDDWVPVDQSNLRTRFPGVYAIGDVCSGQRTVPKAGIFAEAAARVVAEDIAAAIEGGEPPAPYEGSGICYAEFGGGLVGKVEVNFLRGDAPAAQPREPSLEYADEKHEFGAVRRKRWFGHS